MSANAMDTEPRHGYGFEACTVYRCLYSTGGYECNSSKCNEGFVRSDKPLQAPRGHLMGANPRC